MKWYVKSRKTPKEGDVRIRHTFAWYPRLCEDKTYRWLETVAVTETWVDAYKIYGENRYISAHWRMVRCDPLANANE